MALFNASLVGGSSVEIDGVAYDGDLKLVKKTIHDRLPDLPFDLKKGNVVLYQDEIHVLGGNDNDGYTKHYKLANNEWVEVATIPCKVQYQSADVFQGLIYAFDGRAGYTFDGAVWTQKFSSFSLTNIDSSTTWVIKACNNILYLLPYYSSDSIYPYYYDGTSMKTFSLPYTVEGIKLANYKNSLHCLCGDDSNSYTKHYRYNGSTWTSFSTLPCNTYGSAHVDVIDDELHLYGMYTSSTTSAYNNYNYCTNEQYIYKNGVWEKRTNAFPNKIRGGASMALDSNLLIVGSEVFLLAGSSTSNKVYPYAKQVFIANKSVYESEL